MDVFFAQLDSAPKKPAILKIVEPYSEQFIPKLCNVALPKPLTELYDPDSLHLEYLSLLELCEERFQSIKVYLILLYVLLYLNNKSAPCISHAYMYIPYVYPMHTATFTCNWMVVHSLCH